eukprot:Amastigsp_a842419_14.p5 type:complete len:114 gc:universal Amastigsp_a842419_14:468-127(-)
MHRVRALGPRHLVGRVPRLCVAAASSEPAASEPEPLAGACHVGRSLSPTRSWRRKQGKGEQHDARHRRVCCRRRGCSRRRGRPSCSQHAQESRRRHRRQWRQSRRRRGVHEPC